MTHLTRLEDKLGGADNFQAWKYMISLILEENDLDQFISGGVLEPEGDEAKDTHKNNLAKSKRIIAYYIRITSSPTCLPSRRCNFLSKQNSKIPC